jgi:hypothetical protein
VDLQTISLWISSNIGITVDESTVSRHLKSLELSLQLFGTRPMPAGKTRDEYVLGYFEFVKKLHDEGFFNWYPSKIVCIDSLTDSRRTERGRGFQVRGGKQPKVAKNSPSYTNNFVVGVTMAGDVLVVLMFTHDPTFDPNGGRWAEVKAWCKKYRIRTDIIYFTKSTKKYCKEQQAHYTQFHQVNKDALSGSRILHDGGTAFKIDGQLIMDDGANRTVVLPSLQHGELSVCDNKLNAVAKALWKQMRTNIDHSYDAVLLLHCIQVTKKESIQAWWQENFLLGASRLTLRVVDTQLKKKGKKTPIRQATADRYIRSYDKWAGEHDEIDVSRGFEAPVDGPDGP